MNNLFNKFSSKKMLYEKFPKIPYNVALEKYGTDKPDLKPLNYEKYH